MKLSAAYFRFTAAATGEKSYLNVVARDEEGGPADHDEETARDVVSDDVVRDLPLDDNPEGINQLQCWSKERFLGCVNPILRTDSRHEGNLTRPMYGKLSPSDQLNQDLAMSRFTDLKPATE